MIMEEAKMKNEIMVGVEFKDKDELELILDALKKDDDVSLAIKVDTGYKKIGVINKIIESMNQVRIVGEVKNKMDIKIIPPSKEGGF